VLPAFLQKRKEPTKQKPAGSYFRQAFFIIKQLVFEAGATQVGKLCTFAFVHDTFFTIEKNERESKQLPHSGEAPHETVGRTQGRKLLDDVQGSLRVCGRL
jgi:hypothetical protein